VRINVAAAPGTHSRIRLISSTVSTPRPAASATRIPFGQGQVHPAPLTRPRGAVRR
jgi:hypothetical protein